MITRMQVVEEARAWIDTPWHHQASVFRVGVDCGGLLRGVMIRLGLADPDVTKWRDAEKFLGYSRSPDGYTLQEVCETYLIPIPQERMQPGDAVMLAIDKHPQHLGLLSPYRYGGLAIIHATNAARPPRVIETRLLLGRSMRFVAAYALPGVA